MIRIPSTLLATLLLFFMVRTVVRSQDHSSDKKNIPLKLELSYDVPMGGNSWVVDNDTIDQSIISKDGLHNWKNPDKVIRTYFKTDAIGDLHLGLNIKEYKGASRIKISVGEISKEIGITDADAGKIEVGVFKILKEGYHYIELQGIEKSTDRFPDIDKIWIGGKAASKKTTYVKDQFYWGRRGPSAHLRYELPKGKDILWFYNEIKVPEGEDVLGSYYMTNGFREGYFGIQVNSETERRILFSVWSPYVTQNPKDIPEGYKIILLKKGKKVTAGEFGDEGSGGQSFRVFNWKAENTYRFLLKCEPAENNSTDYTAYFFAPEENTWQLIASFRRPHISTYLKKPHSFLENFLTETGYISRKAIYANQWALDTEGQWHELTKAKFTADATARKGARLDYAGGSLSNTFFMRNCGFFNSNTLIDSFHERKANGVPPQIDFSKLE